MARDSDTGEYREQFGKWEFLEVLRGGNQMSTQEVAEEVGCVRRTATARLSELEEEGQVTSRDVGRAKLWSIA